MTKLAALHVMLVLMSARIHMCGFDSHVYKHKAMLHKELWVVNYVVGTA